MNFFHDPTPEPEEYTFVELDGLKIRLIPEHSLWGHILFNAGIILGRFIETLDLKEQTILELGAGAGFPSLIAARNGAIVTSTDFPEPEILDNLNYNATQNCLSISIRGLLFGSDIRAKFDVVLAADCIQLVSEHQNILDTLIDASDEHTRIFISYEIHEPDKAEKQQAFFLLALKRFELVRETVTQCDPEFMSDDAIYQRDARKNCTIVEMCLLPKPNLL